MKTWLLTAAVWGFEQPLVPACDGAGCDWNQLIILFNNLLVFAIKIGAFVGGVAFAWAGIMYLHYGSNPAKREQAKQILWRVLIGFIAILAAAVLVKTILGFVIDTDNHPELNNLFSLQTSVAHADSVSNTITSKYFNPTKAENIAELITKILDALYKILLPVVALYIMYAGMLYVLAQGNEAKLKKAHDALRWSLVGAALVLGAFVLVKILQGTVAAISSTAI